MKARFLILLPSLFACAQDAVGLDGRGLECSKLEPETQEGLVLGLSRDGRWVARFSDEQRLVLFRDRCTSREWSLPSEVIGPVSMSEDAARIALITQGVEGGVETVVVDASGEVLFRAPSAVTKPWISGDGQRVAYIGPCVDDRTLCATVAGPGLEPIILRPEPTGLFHGLAPDRDLEHILVRAPNEQLIWTPKEGERGSFGPSPFDALTSADGTEALVWIPAEDEESSFHLGLLQLMSRTVEPVELDGWGYQLDASADLRYITHLHLAQGASQNEAWVTDRLTGRSQSLSSLVPGPAVWNASISADGHWLAVPFIDGTQNRFSLIENPLLVP